MRFSEKFKVIGDIRPLDYSDAEIQHDVMSWVLELENMFGPATDEMSFGGVYSNASDNDGPCIYYPYDYPREVMVQLVGLALRDKNVARFQLAHEMVHCLSPSGKVSAKVFEEGAAAWYQQRLSTKEMNGIVMLGNPRYMAARKLYMKLCKKNKDAIKRLRQIQPKMWEISGETFSAAGLSVSAELQKGLLCSFEDFQVNKVFESCQNKTGKERVL